MKQTTTTNASGNGETLHDIITPENVITIGERIALKALKTNLSAGSNSATAEKRKQEGKPTANGNFNFLYSLYTGLINDIHTRQANGLETFSDGYDIAQTAITALCGYIGKQLSDSAENGETDKNGAPVTILRATFRAVNRYIMGERRKEYKRAYVDTVNDHGETVYYEIPLEWDMPTATDFNGVREIIAGMNLTDRQAKILYYRLRGKSLHEIARILGIRRQTLQEHMQAIQRKFNYYTTTHPKTE